jgi:hypothetical protein
MIKLLQRLRHWQPWRIAAFFSVVFTTGSGLLLRGAYKSGQTQPRQSLWIVVCIGLIAVAAFITLGVYLEKKKNGKIR